MPCTCTVEVGEIEPLQVVKHLLPHLLLDPSCGPHDEKPPEKPQHHHAECECEDEGCVSHNQLGGEGCVAKHIEGSLNDARNDELYKIYTHEQEYAGCHSGDMPLHEG